MRKMLMNRNHQTVQNTRNESHGGSCKEQLERLRALDFAIQETILYLDAYPNNRQALAFYHELIAQRKTVAEAYEKSCAPLTFMGNTSHTSWDWIEGPWPWEAEAN